MPPIPKIKKEDILQKAYEIAKEKGINGVNARAIARELNVSVQPIFRNFSNMEELKKELVKKIVETYREYVKVDETKENPYKQMGMGYLRFAKENPELYKIIFMSQAKLPPEEFIMQDATFNEIQKYASMRTKINEEKIKDFHTRIWIFTHGLATLIANKTCDFTDEELGNLLTEEVEAIKSLDKYKNN